MTVLHRHRFVQTGQLVAVVGRGPATFTIDAVIRPDTADLRLATPDHAAISVNRGTAGQLVTTTAADRYTEIAAPSELTGVLDTLKAVLDRLVDRPEVFSGYGAPEFETLMVDLAIAGRGLHRALFGRVGLVDRNWHATLRTARRLSVYSAQLSTSLPLELVYDARLADGFDAAGTPPRLCPDAPAQQATGRCRGDCPGAAAGRLVCPFGFWGVRKSIERYVVGASGPSRTALGVLPDVEWHRLPLDDVLGAASARADHNDTLAWTRPSRTYREYGWPTAGRPWRSWPRSVGRQARRPTSCCW